ncbi:alpha/beta hydrolase [Sporosarcina thermotolerans]|uniref:Alpha/beta hydrolase n=1 Tax=Sporosarcina thermotolerans TaxID=633404 RepID=A0AAW9A7G1_9BACL|nr:alpha/beta hydrolase [Sporosarcina thermotolerans]MDW0117541.1 alpha/beta hydrolase [Sporosarcina thermotolerans]WHT49703.1 alpha/beta hydrolase [Sporosarcina thermotolerans]
MVEKYITVDNGRIWTEKRGKGSLPVILISGGPGSSNYLEPLSFLIDDICEVIMFDPKGCGRSDYDGNGYDLESCLEDMERIRKEYGFKKWVVIGHSWGADLGLAYSLVFPQSILGYVSISGTGVQNDRDWKDVYNRKKEEIGELKPDFEYEANVMVHRSLINSWRAFIKKPLLLKDISQLQIPSLFIYAENDIRPSWSIRQISRLISNSRYIEIKGAEHYIWLSKKNELGEVLRAFIKTFVKFTSRYDS